MVMAHGMSTVGGGRREKVMITGWEGEGGEQAKGDKINKNKS